jgi:hypothetical protein
MTSIRLPSDIEKKLNQVSRAERITKSELIKIALKRYFDYYFNKTTPFELGRDLFGKYGSGNGGLSKNYKKILKEKINAKFSH